MRLMRQAKISARSLLAFVCLAATPCLAWQGFPEPDKSAPSKPRPAEKDAGFAPPETVSPGTPRAPEQPAGFQPPQPVAPLQSSRNSATAVSLGANPLMASARSHFAAAIALSDFRRQDGTPFHLHAIFTAVNDPDLAQGGTVTEIWNSPTSWRREAIAGSTHLVETRDGARLYRQVVGASYAPRRLDDLLDALTRGMPSLDESFVETDWQQGSELRDGASLLRIANGDPQRDPAARVYWFDVAGRLCASYETGLTITFTDFEAWKNGNQIARHLELTDANGRLGGIWIDKLDPAPAQSMRFVLDGVSPIPLSDSAPYDGPYFVPPNPVYRPTPVNPPPGEGVITIQVHLDQHGHVRSAQVKHGINDALDAAALNTAWQWEFTPALLKGRPTPSNASVDFQF